GKICCRKSKLGLEGRLSSDPVEPCIQLAQSDFALLAMPFLAVADFLLERGEQVKRYVSGLEIFCFCFAHIVQERAQSSRAGRGKRRLTLYQCCGFDAGDHARSDGLDVAFHPTD